MKLIFCSLSVVIVFLATLGIAGNFVDETYLIESFIAHSIHNEAFPGAVVLVGNKDGVLYHRAFGKYTYDFGSPDILKTTIFDVASLTKVIATTSAIMHLYDRDRLDIDDRVVDFLPEFAYGDKSDVTIKHLLLHTSGLPSWKPYYQETQSREEMVERVIATPLETKPGEHYLYSDLGMIILGELVETVSGVRIDEYAAENIFVPLGMHSTMFNPPEDKRKFIAPTEIDTTWRNMLVHGVVHDENAYNLDGVAGHAGLFSNAPDLSRFAAMMLHEGELDGIRIFNKETVRLFTNGLSGLNDRALGWGRKTAEGYSPAGTLFSPLSYGHTGFTGTSIWIDPVNEIYAVFLTNRVHPVRENTRIVDVRPQLHDLIMTVFRKPDS